MAERLQFLYPFVFCLGGILFVCSPVVGLVAVCQMTFKHMLRKSDAHEILFVMPWPLSAFGGMLCLLCFLGPLKVALDPNTRGDLSAIVMMDCILACIGIFILRLSVRQRMRFDLDSRKYYYTESLFIFQRTVSGNIDEDIAGIKLAHGSRAGWRLRIAWKWTREFAGTGMLKWGGSTLGICSSQEDALSKAAMVSALIGVPVVPNSRRLW